MYDTSGARAKFAAEQRSDGTLRQLFELAEAGSDKFFVECGVLYRRGLGAAAPDDKLLVLPVIHRSKVIDLAHDCPLAGHRAKKTTYHRIANLFFWPKMMTDISQRVRTCRQCQLIAPIKTSDRAPLQEVPVVGEIFSDLSVDVCGAPWPLTPRRNKYLLTVLCNASKYAWAFPVTNLRVQTLATKLLKLFASIGVPKVLRVDAAAQWRSALFQELTKSLEVKVQMATPFHHETIGGLERLHHSLENSVKTFIHEQPTKWDEMIDYLLFAYNSAVHCSTKYSPHMMVFGRDLRSALNVFRETLTDGQPELPKTAKNVIEYTAQLRDSLETVQSAARVHQESEKSRHKRIHDRRSTERVLQPGDQVWSCNQRLPGNCLCNGEALIL